MKTKSLSLVSVGLILLAGLVVSNYLVTRGLMVRRTAATPIFYGEELAVNKAVEAVKAITDKRVVGDERVVREGEGPMSNQVAKPVPLSIIPPQITFSVLPTYPESALSQGLGGKTLLAVFVGPAGEPEKVEVKASSGVDELDQSAVAAVSQWKFSPAAQAGAVLASWLEIPVRFEVK